MYLYFDKSGTLKEIINDIPARVGSENWNKIYVYFEGFRENNITTGWMKFFLPNSTYYTSGGSAEIPFTTHYIGATALEIPYDKERDLKFFEYFKKYEFFMWNVPVGVLGTTGSVGIETTFENSTTDYSMGSAAIQVNGTSSFLPDEHISIAQWNELKKLYNNTIGSFVLRSGDSNISGTLSPSTNNTVNLGATDHRWNIVYSNITESTNVATTNVATANLNVSGTTTTNNLSVSGKVSDLIPNTNKDLGSAANRWDTIYTQTIDVNNQVVVPSASVNGNASVVGNITVGGLINNTDLQNKLNAKQNNLTFDNTPTANSDNPVKSKGIKSYVDNADANLQEQIDGLSALARYLSGWNAVTGLADTNPPVSPYTYKTGDYFIVTNVGATNYRPNGTTYATGVASTTVETATVKVNDYYRFDGTVWKLEINSQRDVTFASITGQPTDNTNLATALNAKANVGDIPDISVKMDNTNPVGTGSLSINRQSGETIGADSVAVGRNNIASGLSTFAEGFTTTASNDASHAEGFYTIASGKYSHAEGYGTVASGESSHAEGRETTASGSHSHAEGTATVASGSHSHADGLNVRANHRSQHVFGEFNEADTSSTAATARGNYVEIVGNGTSSTRSNARTLDWNGNEVLSGNITANSIIKNGGTADQFLKADGSVDTSVYLTSITGTQVTDALGFIPYNSTNPDGYITKDVNNLTNYTTTSDLTTALGGKQDTLTSSQIAAVNSGIDTTKVEAIATNTQDISDIEALIPNEASSSNQLADKSFVNSSIASSTSNFLGTLDVETDLGLTYGATTSQVATALNNHPFASKSSNDYCFAINKDTLDNTIFQRFKYDGTNFLYEYTLNNSSFTAVQWDAINSGITSGKVATYDGYASQIAGKQDTIDANNKLSANLVSGLSAVATGGSYNDLTDKPTIPTKTSDITNDSGFVYADDSAVSNPASINADTLNGQQASYYQQALVSGTNLKTINNTSLLGAGNIDVSTDLSAYSTTAQMNSAIAAHHDSTKQNTLTSGTTIKTVNSTSLLGSGNIAVQPTLVSGTNIKTINGNSLLGSGNITISGSGGATFYNHRISWEDEEKGMLRIFYSSPYDDDYSDDADGWVDSEADWALNGYALYNYNGRFGYLLISSIDLNPSATDWYEKYRIRGQHIYFGNGDETPITIYMSGTPYQQYGLYFSDECYGVSANSN